MKPTINFKLYNHLFLVRNAKIENDIVQSIRSYRLGVLQTVRTDIITLYL